MSLHIIIPPVVYFSSGTSFSSSFSSSSICGELHPESICSNMLKLGISLVVFWERHKFLENKLAAENTDFLNYFLGLGHYFSSYVPKLIDYLHPVKHHIAMQLQTLAGWLDIERIFLIYCSGLLNCFKSA